MPDSWAASPAFHQSIPKNNEVKLEGAGNSDDEAVSARLLICAANVVQIGRPQGSSARRAPSRRIPPSTIPPIASTPTATGIEPLNNAMRTAASPSATKAPRPAPVRGTAESLRFGARSPAATNGLSAAGWETLRATPAELVIDGQRGCPFGSRDSKRGTAERRNIDRRPLLRGGSADGK